MHTHPHIRPMRRADLPGVLAIQQLSFDAALAESAANFDARFDRFGPHFRVAEDAGALLGYMLCFPWRLGDIPRHNRPFDATLPAPDGFYLHDISLHPASRGRGLSHALLAELYRTAQAAGFAQVSLVAVAQSGRYWDKQGFTAVADQDAAYITRHYGPGARLMQRPLELASPPPLV